MHPAPPDISPRFATIASALAILIVLAVNIPYVTAFFSQDDFAGLNVDAKNIRDFAGFFKPEPVGHRLWYRPLSFQLRFWLMREMFGFNPAPFHLLSLLLHCLNILLLRRFLRYLTGRLDISALAAFLYALCGAHQIALYWVSAGVDVFMAFFYLCGLNAFLSWRMHPDIMRGIGICLLFILALLSKETAVSFPFALLLTELFFNGDVGSPRPLKTSRILIYVALFAILAAYLTFWFLMQYRPGGAEYGYAPSFNPLKLLLNLFSFALQAFVGTAILYAALQSWSADSPREAVSAVMHSRLGFLALAAALGFLAAIAACIRSAWKGFSPQGRKPVLWGLAWFVLCLMPVLPLAEHNYAYYMNIALIGFSGALASLALGIGRAARPGGWLRKAGWFMLALYIANFAFNAYLSAKVRPIPRRSVIAKTAFDRIVKLHPSFEDGALLFILDADGEFRWAVDDGLMYKAYYADGLRYCFVLLEGEKIGRAELEKNGWEETRPMFFYSFHESMYIQRDEDYFIEKYLSGEG